jgi:hypothetical protein
LARSISTNCGEGCGTDEEPAAFSLRKEAISIGYFGTYIVDKTFSPPQSGEPVLDTHSLRDEDETEPFWGARMDLAGERPHPASRRFARTELMPIFWLNSMAVLRRPSSKIAHIRAGEVPHRPPPWSRISASASALAGRGVFPWRRGIIACYARHRSRRLPPMAFPSLLPIFYNMTMS